MPRASIKFIIFVLLSLWNVWESTEGALAPEISTQAGRFSSSVTSEHHSAYLGIRCDPFHFGYCYRYAIAERFRAPQMVPIEPNTTFDVSNYGPLCYQDNPRDFHTAEMSEDCLSLNIWVPTAAESQMAMPVLVHVHGGAFFIGGGSNRVYNATPFTSKGIIFVTLNYRLGVLGFYRHPDLTSAQPNAPTNFGLLDQALAFKWIRGNIREFGGDPNNINVMGESAGALSILHHLTSPAYLADPFFKRAILQSATISESTSYNLNDGYRIGSMWAYEAGCSTPGRVVECMRKIEPQKLARTMLFRWSVVEDKYMKHNLIFPLNDGVNFPSLTTAFKEGRFDTQCQLIFGGNSDDASAFTFFSYPLIAPSYAEFEHIIEISFTKKAAQVLEAYHPSKYGNSTYGALKDILNDVRFRCPTRRVLTWTRTSLVSPAHAYMFDYIPAHGVSFLGAYHGVDGPFVFTNPSGTYLFPSAFSAAEWEFAYKINGLFVSFVLGQLSDQEWSPWKANSQASETTLYFMNRGSRLVAEPIQDADIEKCELWDQWYPNGPDMIDGDIRALEPYFHVLANSGLWMLVSNLTVFVGACAVLVTAFVIRRLCRSRK